LTGDEQEIRDLLTTYGRLLDAGEYHAVGGLFGDGVLLDPKGRELARGSEEIAAFYKRTVVLRVGSPGTEHETIDIVITIDGDSASSTARFRTTMDGAQVAAGRYEDTFVRDEQRWRFASRRFFLDDARGISAHVRRLPESPGE
jgi:ketosteroid isomerase-like protein